MYINNNNNVLLHKYKIQNFFLNEDKNIKFTRNI